MRFLNQILEKFQYCSRMLVLTFKDDTQQQQKLTNETDVVQIFCR